MKSGRYLRDLHKLCEFNHWEWCEGCMEYHQWKDNNLASGVYVSDDSLQRAIYICGDCARHCETEGDGPVFWWS